MKEFIEKLIGKLEEAKGRANRHYNYGDETAYRHSIEIVNELAEGHNNDFCEWRKGKGLYLHRASCGEQDSYDDSYRYCPYCGKKIKIVELGKGGLIFYE